jgi:thiosulfate/3-mercaptopyruvate sulfurtransferase
MSNSLKINKPLVSVNWLHQNIEATNLIVLNGTLPKVTAKSKVSLVEENQISNARFFDIKNVFSVQGAQFPNTFLPAEDFEKKATALGIDKDACIVVYDEHGMYSSPRVWWLFKTMGFENVAVLDGGFPAWKEAGFTIEKKAAPVFAHGNFTANEQSNLLIASEVVLNAMNDASKLIVDARSSGRFHATDPEPRAEIRSGHIPNSKSLPYSVLVSNGALKSEEKLKELYKSINPNNKEMVFSCGSGITACVLALGASVAGYKNVAVYDGSWTEYAQLT